MVGKGCLCHGPGTDVFLGHSICHPSGADLLPSPRLQRSRQRESKDLLPELCYEHHLYFLLLLGAPRKEEIDLGQIFKGMLLSVPLLELMAAI